MLALSPSFSLAHTPETEEEEEEKEEGERGVVRSPPPLHSTPC